MSWKDTDQGQVSMLQHLPPRHFRVGEDGRLWPWRGVSVWPCLCSFLVFHPHHQMGFFDLFRRKKKSKLGISSDQFKKGRVLLTRSAPVLPSLRGSRPAETARLTSRVAVSPELRSLSSQFDVIAELDQRSLPPIRAYHTTRFA